MLSWIPLNTISKDSKWRQISSLRPCSRSGERKLIATYLYNAQGQRTQKVTKHGTTVYHYDLNGHLMAETDKNGTLQRAYVWLDNLPLVQIDVKGHDDDKGKNKAKEHIAYLHTDHLGTPRLATDANQQIVWRWDSDAFGAEKPEHEDEADDDHKDITVNLRFAGQYFDKETRLFYNWHRYYDPRTGRYPQSDSIGLRGGLNTYLYGNANPLRYIDPQGTNPLAPVLACVANPSCIAAIGVGTVATGAAIQGAINSETSGPVIDPTKPIPPQLPGYVPESQRRAETRVPADLLPPGPSNVCDKQFTEDRKQCESSCANFATRTTCIALARVKYWICKGGQKPNWPDSGGPDGGDGGGPVLTPGGGF